MGQPKSDSDFQAAVGLAVLMVIGMIADSYLISWIAINGFHKWWCAPSLVWLVLMLCLMSCILCACVEWLLRE